MFEIVCEVANTSGKTLTIETSIPEAEKPDVQMLKSGQQMGVFASQIGSTVKITVVSVETADRIKNLETALREIAQNDYGLQGMIEDGTDTPEAKAKYYAGQVDWRRRLARKALEGKDD